MAYEKTLWKGREGENLDRYLKYDETEESVVLVNSPDSLEEPGTPLSPENMNHIEEGIEEAHDLIAAEELARTQGDVNTLAAAKGYTDEAQLANNTWLPAVPQKSALDLITGLNPKLNYLCRVIADPVQANNGVYQAIAGWSESPVWTFFSDNQDWIDENELDEKIGEHNENGDAHGGIRADLNNEVQNRGNEDNRVLNESVEQLAAHNNSTIAHPDIRTAIAQIAAGGGGSGGGAGISETFTFVVDSDYALMAWATAAPGNDYSRVLIKAGTWTYNDPRTSGGTWQHPLATIDLSDGRTRSIVGESGSKIVIQAMPTDELYLSGIKSATVARNVTIGVYFPTISSNNGSIYASGYGFFECTDLISCNGSGSCTNIFSSSGYGFFECTNLINCNGYCGDASHRSNTGTGFYRCTNLINCNGYGDGAAGAWGYGFFECTNLINCNGYCGGGSGCEFGGCTHLSSCKGNKFDSCYIGFGCTGFFYQCWMESPLGGNAYATPWDNTSFGGYNGNQDVNSTRVQPHKHTKNQIADFSHLHVKADILDFPFFSLAGNTLTIGL